MQNILVFKDLQMEEREKPMHPGAYENWLLSQIAWVLIMPPVGCEIWGELPNSHLISVYLALKWD